MPFGIYNNYVKYVLNPSSENYILLFTSYHVLVEHNKGS